MRVAVTGGNGFIGVPCVEALQGFGVEVVTASRRPGPSQAAHVTLDVSDPATWPNLLGGNRPQRLLHLAWGCLTDFNDPRHYLEFLAAHLSFLDWCVRHGIADITVAGTCFEYGLAEGLLTEEMPAQPVSAYGIAKDALRRSLEHLACTVPFSLKWARVFFVRGDREREKGVFNAIRQTVAAGGSSIDLSWGEQLRDYLPRAQVGRFLAHLCLQDTVLGVVNCCSGRPVSMRRLIEEYCRQWPGLQLRFGAVPYRPYEPMAFWGGTQRMDAVLNSPVRAAQAGAARPSTIVTPAAGAA